MSSHEIDAPPRADTVSGMSQLDIRIGTLAPMEKGAAYLKQILPHGFESFSLTFWQKIGGVNIERTAKEVIDTIGDKAVISSIGMFGNPLTDESCARDFGRCIDACKSFNCDIVAGFAGAVEGKPLPESMPQFKKVWGDLAKRAEANGVRIALENCDMGGTWERPQWNIAHAPTAWEMMFNEVPSPALGLEWEPCHQMNSLIDPLPNLRKWIDKVYHVHGKDATVFWDVVRTSGIRGGKQYVYHRTPGFGDTNWTDVISILRMGKFRGSIDIEGWHDPVYRDELEMTGQVHGMNYLKNCRGGAFVQNPK
jgi:sugar phosphate isomerase/epimerase